MRLTPTQLAYVLLRLTLGINFLMHDLTRFISGVDTFVEKTVAEFSKTILPAALVAPYAWALTFVEFGVRVLLILDLFTRAALVVGSLVMVSLIFGSSLQQKWDTVGTQVIYAVFFFLLLHFLEKNRYSLDHLQRRR